MFNSNLCLRNPEKNNDENTNKENKEAPPPPLSKSLNDKSKSFLDSLFAKSNAISKLTEDLTQINTSLPAREKAISSLGNYENQYNLFDKLKPVTFSVPMNKSNPFLDKSNINMNFKDTILGKESRSTSSHLQPDPKKESIHKGGVSFKVKTEHDELVENIGYLKKLLSYQQDFCKNNEILK